jgi:rare lipoprotein A
VKARMVCVFALAVGLTSLPSAATAVASAGDDWCGRAAWFDGGGVTASGEVNEAGALSAAHRTLPFGTRVQVDNLDNGRSVTVRINDRAPFAKGRIILVSRAAAEELGMMQDGTAEVRLTVLDGDGARAGQCGDAAAPVDALAPSGPPALEGDIVVSEPPGPGEGIAVSESPAPAEVPPSSETLAARFAVAFEAESWKEAELAKLISAFSPRIIAQGRARLSIFRGLALDGLRQISGCRRRCWPMRGRPGSAFRISPASSGRPPRAACRN